MALNPAYEDPEDQSIAGMLSFAKALRAKSMDTSGQMMGNIYVPNNPWVNLLTGMAGSGIDRYQTDKLKEREAGRQREYNDFITKRPSVFNEQPSMQEQAGPVMPGQQPLPQVRTGPTERVLKSSTQMLEDQNKWVGGIGQTSNPLLRAIQQQSVTSDFGVPEKMMALEQAGEARKEAASAKAAADAKIAAEKLATAKEVAEAKIAAARDTAEQRSRDKERDRTADENYRGLRLALEQQALDIRKGNADQTRSVVEEKRERAKREDNQKKLAFARGTDRLETLVDDLLDERRTPNLNSALGAIQGTPNTRFLPLTLTPFDRSDAMQKIDALKSYLESKGLEDLRAAGVAPGSVTEREWAKFGIRLANINPLLNETDFREELSRLKQDITAARDRLAKGELDEVSSDAAPAKGSYADAVKLLNSNRTPEMEAFFVKKYGRLP